MVKRNKITLAIALALSSSAAMANYGVPPNDLGAKNSAFGSNPASFSGMGSIVTNPALIGKAQSHGAYIGMTSVKSNHERIISNQFTEDAIAAIGIDESFIAPHLKSSTSTNTNFIGSYRIDENFTLALARHKSSVDQSHRFHMVGTGYTIKNDFALDLTSTELTLAFNSTNAQGYKFGVAATPVLLSGSLKIGVSVEEDGEDNKPKESSSSEGVGFKLGGYLNPADNVTIGMSYASSVKMSYAGQMSKELQFRKMIEAMDPLTGDMDQDAIIRIMSIGDTLEQPAQFSMGLSYELKDFTFGLGYKHIQWENATGYKELGLKDQRIWSVGARYENDKIWVGGSYQFSDTKKNQNLFGDEFQGIGEGFGAYSTVAPQASNTFSLGAGVAASKNLSFDVSASWSEATKNSATVSLYDDIGNGVAEKVFDTTMSGKSDRVSYAFGLTYMF